MAGPGDTIERTMSTVQTRRASLTFAFAIIAVAIIYRHGWWSTAFRFLHSQSGQTATASTTAPNAATGTTANIPIVGGVPIYPNGSQPGAVGAGSQP